MLSILFVCICVSAFALQSEALDSASELLLRPCKATNPLLKECWLQKIEDLRLDLIKGIPELRLPPIDALHIRRLTVGKRKFPLASYEAQFRNITYFGARNFQILDTNIDFDTLVLKLKILLPSIYLAGSLSIDGTVLGFRLLGDGSGEGRFTNLILDLVLDGNLYTKNGKEHIQWKEGSVEITFDNLDIQFYNIIKDPAELQAFNYVFNQNVDALRSIIISFLDRTLGNFVIDVINRVHEAFPKDSLYPIY